MDHLFADETILARWLNDELTAAELKALQEHEAYADLQAIVQEMDQLQLLGRRDEEADYISLKSRIKADRRQPPAPVKRLSYWRWAAAAAVVVIALASWLLLLPQPITYLTQAGERQEITLPDGSKVVLNAASELQVFAKKWSETRDVVLAGEAFFQVTPGIPFTVSTATGKVEVLGTSFNVYARNGILESLCTSGSIRTSSKNGTISQISTAGQGVRLTNNQLELTFSVDPQTTQWPEGESHFEKVPLARVIAELERQFSVDIQYDVSLFTNEDAFNGWFDNQDLEKALRNVLRPMRIAYEQKGKVIYLRRE
jgi:ferric-dicitrate binding protein FerR (iron transport regulator)